MRVIRQNYAWLSQKNRNGRRLDDAKLLFHNLRGHGLVFNCDFKRVTLILTTFRAYVVNNQYDMIS